jgi:hypothetical protein
VDSWNSLPNNRKIKEAIGYSVIIPNTLPDVVPLECPACGLLMRDHDDVLSFKASQCCSECQLKRYSVPSSSNRSNSSPSR